MRYKISTRQYNNLESLFFYSFLIKHRRNTEEDRIAFNKTRRALIHRLDKDKTPFCLTNMAIELAEISGNDINFMELLRSEIDVEVQSV